jgi:hypothetical protein
MGRGRLIWTIALLILLALLVAWYVTGFRATQP